MRVDKALADLNEAIRLDPRCSDGLRRSRPARGRARSRYDKALADCDEAHPARPAERHWPTAIAAPPGWRKGEFDKALADLQRGDPARPAECTSRGSTAACSGRGKASTTRPSPTSTRSIRLDPGKAPGVQPSAWIRATCPDAKYRDGKQAVASATRACELTEWKDAITLDTLAAAYAEAGDFDAAVKWQTKANAMFPEGKDKSEGEARLKLYQARKPYRETRP